MLKTLLKSFQIIFTRKDSTLVMLGATLIFCLLIFLLQNGKATLSVLSLPSLSLGSTLFLASKVLFDVQGSFTVSTGIVALVGSLLGGINLALAYTYIKVRGEAIRASGLYTGVGLVVAFLGIGCAACGTAVLSLLLGLFGFSAVLTVFPYQGEELGYIGIGILLLATYSLSKKVIAPTVC